MNHIARTTVFALLATAATGALAATPQQAVQDLQDAWAHARYETPEKQREAAFKQLAARSAAFRSEFPQDPGVLIWDGIVLATYAGEKGGLGALSICKQARGDFERAIELDGTALDGSAYTSLGSLYYQVPGWPVGFGDEDKARALLEKALALNPDGIDSNFFYGDFLLEQADYAGAKRAFDKALAAPPRPGRELADQGRRAEIEAKLAEVARHLRD